MTDHAVELATGRLRVRVHEAAFPLEDLCGFAARDNPRRGFLFVSKVLGKHWPAEPAQMQAVHEYLAQRLDLGPGPWLFVAMAETATGLGQGVFESVLARAPEASALFVHSTRYRLPDRACLSFQEPHCHAPEHLLHEPEDAPLRERFRNARELILIDDEISTGTTLCNLADVYRRYNPALRRVHWVAITDFSGTEAVPACARRLGLPVSRTAALAAELDFTPRPGALGQTAAAAPAFGDNRLRPEQVASRQSGRLGVDGPTALPKAEIASLSQGLARGSKALVLGTGEYMHSAYLVGRGLEAFGLEVRVQSTTRSPIRLGADIERRMVFRDNYGEGIPNYLYNVDPAAYERIIVCHETPVDGLADLVGQLGPNCLTWGHARTAPFVNSMTQ